ncbi:MAG: SRPBCC domain-containing protein [Gemmatimonadales bacterium]|nr:SRPBCC domain-containing protein [Gemmatimonadales bacterium]
MSTDTGTTLRVSRLINADPVTVWKAWTEADHLKQWSCPESATVAAAEVDLSVGGKYRLRMRGAEGKAHTAVGTYREITPPRRLVYTWDWEEEDSRVGETLVTVEFTDLGGTTEVVLTHELFPNTEAKAAHEQGWTSCLNRLEQLFAGVG